jgi:hypothetical protein
MARSEDHVPKQKISKQKGSVKAGSRPLIGLVTAVGTVIARTKLLRGWCSRVLPQEGCAMRLVDRLELRFSKSRRVDGLWVGVASFEPEPILRRVEEALRLIQTYDQLRYDRLISDLERVWVRDIPGAIGNFNKSMRACTLDREFVVAERSSPELIAGTIVHEATHARLDRCGIDYSEELRSRIEAVCIRRELAFATKLPNGEQLRAQAASSLEFCVAQTLWTNVAMADRHDEAAVERLRQLGAPEWVGQSALFLRNQRLRVRSFTQRVVRFATRR